MDDKTPDVYLRHVLDAICRIERYVTGVRKEDFLSDDSMVAAAVVREFEIIGEATEKIPEELRLKHPAIPWKQIVGARDKVIHEYFGVDLDIIWKTVIEDLPVFKRQREALLEEYA